MPRLNELDLAVGTVERAEHAVDAVAGISEHLPHAPRVQALDHEITDGLRHLGNSLGFDDGNGLSTFGCGCGSNAPGARPAASPCGRDWALRCRRELSAG